jgi:hypothetical protein
LHAQTKTLGLPNEIQYAHEDIVKGDGRKQIQNREDETGLSPFL